MRGRQEADQEGGQPGLILDHEAGGTEVIEEQTRQRRNPPAPPCAA
jgi:hypothetical protein